MAAVGELSPFRGSHRVILGILLDILGDLTGSHRRAVNPGSGLAAHGSTFKAGILSGIGVPRRKRPRKPF